mgnify:FL=1
MRHINDIQIQKELDQELTKQAILRKRELELEEREELINGIIGTAIVVLLVILGGFVNAI